MILRTIKKFLTAYSFNASALLTISQNQRKAAPALPLQPSHDATIFKGLNGRRKSTQSLQSRLGSFVGSPVTGGSICRRKSKNNFSLIRSCHYIKTSHMRKTICSFRVFSAVLGTPGDLRAQSQRSTFKDVSALP